MPYSDGVSGENLLRRNVESSSSKVDLPKVKTLLSEESSDNKPEGVNARYDNPQTGPLGSPFLDPAKSEDDGSLVLINSLKSTDVSREPGPRRCLP